MSTNTNKYRCLETRVVQDGFTGTKDETKFVAGKDYPLTDESYARWGRRGVLGPIPEKTKRRRKAKAADNGAPAEDAPPKAKTKAKKRSGPGAAMATTG